MDKCSHNTISNKIKVYLTFENTGYDHNSYYVYGVLCSECSAICSLKVKTWEYSSQGLDFDITPTSGDDLRSMNKLSYRHYPIWIGQELSNIHRPTVEKISEVISTILPSRLVKHVINVFNSGKNYAPKTVVSKSRYVDDFWKALHGYTRTILQKERPPIWI